MFLKALRTKKLGPYRLLEFVLYCKNVPGIATQIIKTRNGRSSHTLRRVRTR